MRVLFAADGWDVWAPALREACPEMELVQDAAADSVDAIIYAPNGGGCDFAAYPSAKLVQSLWAGVECIALDDADPPLAWMVDPSLEQMVVCAGWTLRLHLEMDRFAQDGRWRNEAVPPLASARRVTVFGAGALGGAVAKALRRLGFDVATWSASGRSTGDIPALAGQDFDAALARSDIAILLLPDTAGTRDLFDAEAIARMPEGAALINPGRGTLIDDGALIAALDRGHLRHAVLDVADRTVTGITCSGPRQHHRHPHIAAATRRNRRAGRRREYPARHARRDAAASWIAAGAIRSSLGGLSGSLPGATGPVPRGGPGRASRSARRRVVRDAPHRSDPAGGSRRVDSAFAMRALFQRPTRRSDGRTRRRPRLDKRRARPVRHARKTLRPARRDISSATYAPLLSVLRARH